MAKGKAARSRAAKERREREQTEREYFVGIMTFALRQSTVRLEDASKALALITKRLGRRPTLWEEVNLMETFRQIEQGNIPDELKHTKYSVPTKGRKRKK